MRLQPRAIALDGGDQVSSVVAYPDGEVDGFAPGVVLAHGAGNDMNTPFLSAMQQGLAARGYPAAKFNFPYTEKGRRAPDRAVVLEACYRNVIHALRAESPFARDGIVIGGKSMGGRMATHLAAAGEDIAGALLLGYPLHPPRQVDKLRVAHLAKIRVPMLFFCGTRDALCDLDLLRRTLAGLSAPVELHVIEGGDHSFNVSKSLHREPLAVWEEIVETSVRWLQKLAVRRAS